MTIGPVQLVVLGFEGNSVTGEILAELRRLRDHDVIRLIDLLFVSKDESGEVAVMEASDLTQEEAMEFGRHGRRPDRARRGRRAGGRRRGRSPGPRRSRTAMYSTSTRSGTSRTRSRTGAPRPSRCSSTAGRFP